MLFGAAGAFWIVGAVVAAGTRSVPGPAKSVPRLPTHRPVLRAADSLEKRGNGTGGSKLADQINRTDVDSQLQ